ncbi:MAG UNVERIFIED_CONTAM: transcription elongation factor GreA [Rickettsiaceae bacterium]|jgi:transcription elongation factor GreA
MTKFPITQKGYEKLEQEIKTLKYQERPKVVEDIASARAFGDLSENAEYHAAREKQSFIEGRILDLEDKMARAEIIDVTKLSGNNIKFGATVVLIDDDTEEEARYIIVGEYEADITKKRISIVSPIARGLIGKSVGDIVDVKTPGGTKTYEVVSVTFEEFIL